MTVSGNDNGLLLSRLPYVYDDYSDSEPAARETATIFTDRSLYRPGQILFFKAILTRTTADESTVVTDKAVEFVLRDANSREISKQTLVTGEYGSVSGEFPLPQGILPGNFIIETAAGSVGFHVEEYKRPTFEVTFEKIEKTYKFGEEITLQGKASNFSGIALTTGGGRLAHHPAATLVVASGVAHRNISQRAWSLPTRRVHLRSPSYP